MSEHDCGNDAAAYALGALEPREVEAFERHLEGCAVCRDELVAFSRVVGALPMAAPQHRSPRGLRRRVLRSIRAEPVARTRLRRSAALRAASATAAVAALAIAIVLSVGSAGVTREVRASVGLAILRVASGRAELIVNHLRPPSNRRIYELWLEHGGGPPQPSTLFSVNAADRADIGVPGGAAALTRVLVTEEPTGGSLTPTARPVIVASLS